MGGNTKIWSWPSIPKGEAGGMRRLLPRLIVEEATFDEYEGFGEEMSKNESRPSVKTTTTTATTNPTITRKPKQSRNTTKTSKNDAQKLHKKERNTMVAVARNVKQPKAGVSKSVPAGLEIAREGIMVLDMLMRPSTACLVPFKSPFGDPPVTSLRLWESMDLPTTSASSRLLNAGSMGAVQFRDPFRSIIYPKLIDPVVAWQYDGVQWFNQITPVVGEVVPVICALNSTVGVPHHGPVLYPGVINKGGVGFYWVQNGQKIQFQNTLGANAVPMLFEYDPVSNTAKDAYNFTPTTVAHNATKSYQPPVLTGVLGGYYGWAFSQPTASPNLFQGAVRVSILQDTANTDTILFCHNSVKDIKNHIDAMDDVRVVACSTLATNTAPYISKGGIATACQIPKDVQWQSLLAIDPFKNINSLKSAERLPFEDGAYTYLKPTATTDFDFCNQTCSATVNVSTLGFWYLDTDSEYIAMGIQNPSFSSIAVTFTFTSILEMKTSDQWSAITPTIVSRAAWEYACSKLNGAQQLYPNAWHDSEIFTFLKRLMSSTTRAVVKYGPTVLEVAQILSTVL